MREEIADRYAALTVVVEFPRTFEQISVVVENGGVNLEFRRLAVLLGELRLGIETVYLGNATVHIEEYDALGFGSKVRRFRIQWHFGAQQIALSDSGESEGAKSHGASLEKFASSNHCSWLKIRKRDFNHGGMEMFG